MNALSVAGYFGADDALSVTVVFSTINSAYGALVENLDIKCAHTGAIMRAYTSASFAHLEYLGSFKVGSQQSPMPSDFHVAPSLDEATTALTNATPSSPSCTVGTRQDAGGMFPLRRAMIA